MEWYKKHYGKLFIIPVILLLVSIGIIINNVATTGEIVNRGVSLKGGVSLTADFPASATADQIEASILAAYPESDAEIRTLTGVDTNTFIVNVADIDPDVQVAADSLESALMQSFELSNISVETTGPSLGEAFFNQTIMAVFLAFLWMGWVVYLYFGQKGSLKFGMAIASFIFTVLVMGGTLQGSMGILILGLAVLAAMGIYFYSSVPSGAVILAAASTIIFTLAVVELIDLRLSTAGIAAFLMLIGYSVDTDILLSTRLLKERQGTHIDRLKHALKTGLTMQITTTVAVLCALLLSNSEVIRQIMLIILIGMVGDIIFTWLQNAGILFWHVEKS